MAENKDLEDRKVLMLAFLCIKDVEGLIKRVEVLDRFELTNLQISKVCGCKEQSVRNARQKVKK